MAYEVTATRRRPQKFSDLIGQEFVAETLKNSIQSGKIAHAYLFTGPRGCGKTSTARIMAKALNCEKGPTVEPCGQCAACREIAKGSSLDVIEIDGASNTGVDNIRQIKDEVLFPPNSCRYKIYIIDEVHMITTQAFNALLKTIEEPPPYAIFIFATTELQKVPATIKSRCQQFNFRLVPVEKVKEQLALAAQESGIKADDEALYWIARESTGSMRDSYTLFDQIAAFSDGEMTYDKIRDKLGLVGVDRLNELFEFCVDSDRTNALLKLDEYLQNGVSIEQFIMNCSDYLRSILLIKSGVTKEALLGQAKERYSQKVLQSWNNIQVERAESIFLQLYRDIRYSLSPRYELELALSRLCWLKEYVSPAEVKRAVDLVRPLLVNTKTASVSQNCSPRESSDNNLDKSSVNQTLTPKSQVVHSSSESNSHVSSYKPHFSALDEVTNNSSGEESHPFYKGGAVPPLVNTASVDSYSDNDFDAEDGTYSPDDSSDVLEDSSFVSDEELKNIADSVQEKESREENIFGTQENIENLDECSKLRLELIKHFSVSETMCAAALTKTKNWKKDADCITAFTDSEFEKMQISKYVKQIVQELEKKFGCNIKFEVKTENKTVSSEQKELPQEIKFLRDTFRGTVISGA